MYARLLMASAFLMGMKITPTVVDQKGLVLKSATLAKRKMCKQNEQWVNINEIGRVCIKFCINILDKSVSVEYKNLKHTFIQMFLTCYTEIYIILKVKKKGRHRW